MRRSSMCVAALVAAILLAGCTADRSDPTAGGQLPALGGQPVDPSRINDLLARARDLVRPGSTIQIQSRLGVPTFVWAREAPPDRSRARWITAGAADPKV